MTLAVVSAKATIRENNAPVQVSTMVSSFQARDRLMVSFKLSIVYSA